MLRWMSWAGYDAMALGNRESHPYLAILTKKLAGAKFPVLAANLVPRRRPRPEKVKDYLLRELGSGLRVAVVGLAPQVTAPESWWSRVTDYVFDEPVKTAAGLVRKLRERGEADVIICLSHCGPEVDRKLAELEGVDLVVGGHSHLALEQPERVGFDSAHPKGSAALMYAGRYAEFVGRVELRVEGGRVVEITGQLLPLQERERMRRRRKG